MLRVTLKQWWKAEQLYWQGRIESLRILTINNWSLTYFKTWPGRSGWWLSLRALISTLHAPMCWPQSGSSDIRVMKSSLNLAHIESFRRPLGWNWVSHLLLQPERPDALHTKLSLVSQPTQAGTRSPILRGIMQLSLERPHVHMDVLKMCSSAFLRCLQLSSFTPRGSAASNKIYFLPHWLHSFKSYFLSPPNKAQLQL